MTDLTELIADLVRIDSVNPGLIEAAAGEREIAGFVASWLERAGLEVEVDDALPGRPNVVAVARGLHGGPALMLNGHLDTVGTAGMDEPRSGRVVDGRLYGRGAYDMKSGLAAAMVVAAGARGLGGDVILAAVADEECAGDGTRHLVRAHRADAAIVPEPTDLRAGVAHKGFVGFKLETDGVAAHGSMPERGVDAIAGMGPVLVALRHLDARLQQGDRHPLLGPASLHASLIEGGREFSTYPDRCTLHGEMRTIPGMADPAGLLQEALDGSGATARLSIEMRADWLENDPGERIAELLVRHAGAPAAGLPYWTDAATLASAGIPTVLYGPAGDGAHAVVEWVDLASVERVAEVLAAVAREFCSDPAST